MPSPFPGMDPYIEDTEWEDFHTRFNTAVSDALSPGVEPAYVVRVEKRVYVEHLIGPSRTRRADVAIMSTGEEPPSEGGGVATATIASPVECLMPEPEEMHETFITIRDRESRELVTVIETLSPGNKRPGSSGQREYLAKREEVLKSPVHLVELDLLRGGERMPLNSSVPHGDYYGIVSRWQRRPRALAHVWTIRDRLPTVEIPLTRPDEEVKLDLQAVFATVYDRARYHLSINYDEPLVNGPTADEEAWMRDRVSSSKS